MSRATAILVAAVALAFAGQAAAQPVLVDRGVRAGDLWCFPLASDSLTYVYLPGAVRLAENEQGQPQFSFVRYVINTSGDSASASSITQARGGGVLTFLVQLDTPASMVEQAREALAKAAGNDRVTLRGPIVCTEGRYTLVSSVLQPGRESAHRSALATGSAPVLEGNRIALSFDLDPERATLLLRSLAMATPDVSLMFDLTFAGLTDAYAADLTVNWSQVRRSESFAAGGSAFFVHADVSAAIDELRRTQAVELRTAGNDPVTEGLLNSVYGRLLELLFKPVDPERVPEKERGGLMDALGAVLGKGGAPSGRKLLGVGAEVAYQLRDIRSEGRSVMSFRYRASVSRHHLIAFNLGGFHQAHGSDARFFRTVNLGDPAFQQREVQVGIDGALLPELQGVINSITVTLRKTHASGEQTLRELVLDRNNASGSTAGLRMVYGWDGDRDREAWLGYDYRTRWSFRGGGVHATEWTHSEAPMIDLFAPYERHVVQLAGDPEALRARGVRAVVVEVDYPFFSERRRPQLVVRPDEPLDRKQLELTLPIGQPAYDVALTWQLAGGQRLTAKRQVSSGLVFVDELP